MATVTSKMLRRRPDSRARVSTMASRSETTTTMVTRTSSLAAFMRTGCTITTATAPSPMSRRKAGLNQPDKPVRAPMVGRRGLAGCEQRRPAGPVCGQLSGLGLQERTLLRGRPRKARLLPSEVLQSERRTSYSSTRATGPSTIFRRSSGIRAHPGKGMGVGIADYDLDGLMDIFVANDKVYNSLLSQQGAS